MANEQVLANYNVIAAYLAGTVLPFARGATVLRNLISVKPPDPGAKSATFYKETTVSTASIVGEGSQASKSQLVDTPVTPTTQKMMVYWEPTIEALRYARGHGDPERLKADAGKALGQKFDLDGLALASGFSQSVGTTNTTLTEAKLDEAIYIVGLSDTIEDIVGILHPKQARDIRTSIIGTTATFFTGGANQSVAQHTRADLRGYLGKYLDTDLFQSKNTPSLNSNVDWGGLVLTRNAICCVEDEDVEVMEAVDPEYGKHKISLSQFVGFAELKDAEGCLVVSKK